MSQPLSVQWRCRRPALFRLLVLPGLLLLSGCRTQDPAVEFNKRITSLEDRVTRLEEELARVRDSSQLDPGQGGAALSQTAAYQRITRKAGHSGRVYRTNGAIVSLKGGGGASFSFEKPDVLKVAGHAVKLPDLSLCAPPGKKDFIPIDMDFLMAPDNRLAWVVVACPNDGDILYLVDMENGRLLQTEFSGPAAPTTSTLWSPDAAFILMESCKGVCNLTLLDTAGNKLDFEAPDLFGYVPPENTEDKTPPKCRILSGDWTGVAVARLKLGCSRKTSQAPANDNEVELTMPADLNVLERTMTVVVQ